jgi:preprotein translocase subunit SecE
MKKQSQHKKKKKTPKKKTADAKKSVSLKLDTESSQKEPVRQKGLQSVPKKTGEKKKDEGLSIFRHIGKAGQFLKESKLELKKVKWPTRKELLASTAVVIVLTLVVAFYLGLVDFGLIKIIKSIIG